MDPVGILTDAGPSSIAVPSSDQTAQGGMSLLPRWAYSRLRSSRPREETRVITRITGPDPGATTGR